MVMVLSLYSTLGWLFGTGDTIRFLRTSFRSTYSSKLSTIFLLLKCSVPSSGSADTSTGGRVSFGPPVGGIIFAQPVMPGNQSKMEPNKSSERKSFIYL